MAAESINTVIEDATKTWTKEDHISFLTARVKARMQRMEELSESMRKLQSFNQRDLLRIEELRLLRDIRDGKVRLVHGETGQPFNVRVYYPEAGNA